MGECWPLVFGTGSVYLTETKQVKEEGASGKDYQLVVSIFSRFVLCDPNVINVKVLLGFLFV